jgi:hypothetical protein
MLNRATSNRVFGFALMPKWFSAIQLKRQYVFNKAIRILHPRALRAHDEPTFVLFAHHEQASIAGRERLHR